MVLAMKALIALHWVTSHLIWPFKEWLILYFLQDLVYWFSEYLVNHLSSDRPWLPNKVSPRPVIVVSVWPEISHLLRDNLSLPFPMLLVLLDSLILVNSIHKLTYTVSRFPSQRLPCSAGRPTLKVLMATSSKSPSISLNIYQHLSEYVFRVSPSCIVIDNRESKSRGTLLHVIKWDPNARVSSLKESIELAPKPSNHLIATRPKLDGNTLHIKASFLEWIAILWLKWLTCSTGFSTIVHGERWLSKPPRKFSFFNSTCERQPGNLV